VLESKELEIVENEAYKTCSAGIASAGLEALTMTISSTRPLCGYQLYTCCASQIQRPTFHLKALFGCCSLPCPGYAIFTAVPSRLFLLLAPLPKIRTPSFLKTAISPIHLILLFLMIFYSSV